MAEQTSIDRTNPDSQTVYDGREYEARIRFRLIKDATEDEIWEWLEFEIGGGSIASDHPLIDTDITYCQVTDLRDSGRRWFTDWGPDEGNGTRHGKGRCEAV